jgi:nitrogen regulatory protein PII
MSLTERHEILSEIARARFGDFADEDGHLDISGKDRLNNAALAELKTTDWQGGRDGRASSKTTTIRLRDPIAAIAELNKMQHIYEVVLPNFQDNRVIKIIVEREETKKLVERVMAGERTGKLIGGGEVIESEAEDVD